MEIPNFLRNSQQRACARFEIIRVGKISGFFRDVTVQIGPNDRFLRLNGQGMSQVLECLNGNSRSKTKANNSSQLMLQFRQCGRDVWELGDDKKPTAYLEYNRNHGTLKIYTAREDIHQALSVVMCNMPGYVLQSNSLPFGW